MSLLLPEVIFWVLLPLPCKMDLYLLIIESVRLYGKDLPCPKEWEEQLAILPPELLSCGPRDSFGFLNPEVRLTADHGF